MKLLLTISVLLSTVCYADGGPFEARNYHPLNGTKTVIDTFCTHPNYPPIIFKGSDYRFFKYTARYTPKNMLQCFKILATAGDQTLCNFINKSEDEVVEDGLFAKGYHMRKEFGLDGYSAFTGWFHKKGIYYPFAMKTYILLSFQQYLKKERIRWRYNKKVALEGRKELNKAWKKRLDHVFKPTLLEEEPIDPINSDHLDPIEKKIYTY